MAAGWGDLNAMVSRRGALGETRPTSRAAALRGEEFSFGGGSLKIVSQRPGRPRTGGGRGIAKPKGWRENKKPRWRTSGVVKLNLNYFLRRNRACLENHFPLLAGKSAGVIIPSRIRIRER